jgi:hypothetical protein
MKASEVLHGLAELLAGIEGHQAQAEPNRAELVPVEVDNADHSESGVFVPPLQAKLELLKKATGVDSIYDQGGEDGDMTGYGDDNELDRMKHLSGITVIDAASDSEPLDI